jgi:MFS family permease
MNRISTHRRDWILLASLTFCFSFGFAIYGGIFQNFLRDVHHAGPEKLGILESLREVPGLLTVLTAGLLIGFTETRLVAIALFLCAFGVGFTGQMGSYWALVAITAFWSIGAHLWYSLGAAITMNLSEGQEGGRHLGRMNGIGAFAVLLGLGFTWLIKSHVSYNFLFELAGGLVLVAAACSMLIRHQPVHRQKKRLLYRKEYNLFYLLTFLEGCRRQIFGTFASFVLIVVFRQNVITILLLSFINAALSMVASPLFGRWIDRHGERPLMTFYYSSLIFVFAGYALCHQIHLLYGLYIIDNLLFCFSVGITTFLHRIVRPGEFRPCLTMGTTMNHVAAVVVPVLGGVLWKTTGQYQIPFLIGIALLFCSLFVTQRIPHLIKTPDLAAAD